MKVQSKHDRIEKLGAEVVFVAHDTAEKTKTGLLEGVELLYPFAVDPKRDAYRRWGLKRASWWRLYFDPKIWRKFAGLLFEDRGRMRPSGEDVYQLGGDFIIDSAGKVAWARAQEGADRPPVGLLLKELERVAKQGGEGSEQWVAGSG